MKRSICASGSDVGALLLDGVLRGEDEERRRAAGSLAADGGLPLLHRLEHRALGLGAGAVDLVEQHEVGVHRAELGRRTCRSLRRRSGCRRCRSAAGRACTGCGWNEPLDGVRRSSAPRSSWPGRGRSRGGRGRRSAGAMSSVSCRRRLADDLARRTPWRSPRRSPSPSGARRTSGSAAAPAPCGPPPCRYRRRRHRRRARRVCRRAAAARPERPRRRQRLRGARR